MLRWYIHRLSLGLRAISDTCLAAIYTITRALCMSMATIICLIVLALHVNMWWGWALPARHLKTVLSLLFSILVLSDLNAILIHQLGFTREDSIWTQRACLLHIESLWNYLLLNRLRTCSLLVDWTEARGELLLDFDGELGAGLRGCSLPRGAHTWRLDGVFHHSGSSRLVLVSTWAHWVPIRSPCR